MVIRLYATVHDGSVCTDSVSVLPSKAMGRLGESHSVSVSAAEQTSSPDCCQHMHLHFIHAADVLIPCAGPVQPRFHLSCSVPHMPHECGRAAELHNTGDQWPFVAHV